MKTLQSITDKVNLLTYRLHMGLSMLALAVLALMFVALSAVEAKAASGAGAGQINLNPQTKEEYAELYYGFIQNHKGRHAMFNICGHLANRVMDADIVDFDNDGRYELLLYAAGEAPDGTMHATTNVLPAEYVLNYNRPPEECEYAEGGNLIYDIGGFSSENIDVYVTEYNGRPAIVKNNPILKERELRYIAENGVLTVKTVLASAEPELYEKTGKAISACGVKVNDKQRFDIGTKPDFSPEVTYGERLLDYMSK